MSKTVIEQAIEALDRTASEPGSDAWEREKEAMIALQKLAEQPAQQEPFGYFKAEPFGWTDCAETDDGAVALYTTPQAQPAPEIAIADAYRAGVDSGIAAERDACAKVCDDWAKTSYLSEAKSCAKIIRAMGNT